MAKYFDFHNLTHCKEHVHVMLILEESLNALAATKKAHKPLYIYIYNI